MATLLGIDYGHKKIGFATGQTITQTTSPLTIVAQNGEMWNRIDTIFNTWRPKTVVVGKPVLADGNEHPLEPRIVEFIFALNNRFQIEVYREDETLTSHEASQYQSDKSALDAHAAAVFLESWMRANNGV